MPVDHDDMLDKITEGLGDDYRTIVEMVNRYVLTIPINELHDKLLNREKTIALLTNSTIDLHTSANAALFCHQPQRPYFCCN